MKNDTDLGISALIGGTSAGTAISTAIEFKARGPARSGPARHTIINKMRVCLSYFGIHFVIPIQNTMLCSLMILYKMKALIIMKHTILQPLLTSRHDDDGDNRGAAESGRVGCGLSSKI